MQRQDNRPWWKRKRLWAVAVVLLLVVSASGNNTETPERASEPRSAVAPGETQRGAAAVVGDDAETDRDALLTDARRAIDDDEYKRAVALVADLGAADRSRVRKAISRRIAQRVTAALKRGDRGAAKRLLAAGERYGRTRQLTAARAEYRAAKQRASQRAAARRAAKEQAARERAQRRAAEQAAEEAEVAAAKTESAGSGCHPSYDPCVPDDAGDLDCPDIDGPVTVVGPDDYRLDRDGDGTGCDAG